MNINNIKNMNNQYNNHLYFNTSFSILSLSISKNFISSFTIKPIITYNNSLLSKPTIIKDNKDKSGIYKWTHNESGKSYIGSSISLSNRFASYYSLSSLKRRLNTGKSVIYSALLKHGHENFSLNILEYCEPNILIKREQYYIYFLNPEYNICKTAGSTLGFSFKHSEETKTKISAIKKGIKHDISFSINLSKAKRGKKYKKPNLNISLIPKIITNETRLLTSYIDIREICHW